LQEISQCGKNPFQTLMSEVRKRFHGELSGQEEAVMLWLASPAARVGSTIELSRDRSVTNEKPASARLAVSR
jgi:hypothetical protein